MAGKKMGNKYLFTVYIRHALTVEGVMYWYAKELGYGDEEKFWGIVGIFPLLEVIAAIRP